MAAAIYHNTPETTSLVQLCVDWVNQAAAGPALKHALNHCVEDPRRCSLDRSVAPWIIGKMLAAGVEADSTFQQQFSMELTYINLLEVVRGASGELE